MGQARVHRFLSCDHESRPAAAVARRGVPTFAGPKAFTSDRPGQTVRPKSFLSIVDIRRRSRRPSRGRTAISETTDNRSREWASSRLSIRMWNWSVPPMNGGSPSSGRRHEASCSGRCLLPRLVGRRGFAGWRHELLPPHRVNWPFEHADLRGGLRGAPAEQPDDSVRKEVRVRRA